MQSSKDKSWSVGVEITYIEGVYRPVTFFRKIFGSEKAEV
jgi:hypothetical protein